MAKSFNITPTLKKNTKPAPTLTNKTTFKKKVKDLEEIKDKVEQIHREDETEPVVATKSIKEATKKVSTTAKPPQKRTQKAAAKTRKATTVVTADSKRITIVISKKIHKKLKVKAVTNDMTLNELMVSLIEKDLGIA